MKLYTVLLVDDDEEDQEYFIEALHEIDPEIFCHTASDGMHALQVLRVLKDTKLPDFIFLDLNMPNLNGKLFLRQIKADELLRNITVIIYTTSSIEEDIKQTMALGASFFLKKPESFDQLKEVLYYFLKTDQQLISKNILNVLLKIGPS